MTARRFPSPWSVAELDACFVVRDHSGQKLAYVYYEDEPGPASRSQVAYEGFQGLAPGPFPPAQQLLLPLDCMGGTC